MTANHTNDAARQIPLRRRDGTVAAWTLVDPEDYERFAAHRWHLGSTGYARRSVQRDGKAYAIAIHREILGLLPGDRREGDHINGDRLDNRRANLRITTRAQNAQNICSRPGSSSRYRGVSRTASGTWGAAIRTNGRTKWLGTFATEEEAARVAEAARREAFPFAERRDVAA